MSVNWPAASSILSIFRNDTRKPQLLVALCARTCRRCTCHQHVRSSGGTRNQKHSRDIERRRSFEPPRSALSHRPTKYDMPSLDLPCHGMAFFIIGIRVSAELAIASCTGVWQGSEMEAFHEGLLAGYRHTLQVRTALLASARNPQVIRRTKHEPFKLHSWTNPVNA
jgi:hypothetical protein